MFIVHPRIYLISSERDIVFYFSVEYLHYSVSCVFWSGSIAIIVSNISPS